MWKKSIISTIRQQAIALANVDSCLCHHVASKSLNAFKHMNMRGTAKMRNMRISQSLINSLLPSLNFLTNFYLSFIQVIFTSVIRIYCRLVAKMCTTGATGQTVFTRWIETAKTVTPYRQTWPVTLRGWTRVSIFWRHINSEITSWRLK